MNGKGIHKKRKNIYNGLRREERIHISPYVLTGDALCTVVYVNGVYIFGVF
jgi:hypothetical protein